MKKWLKLWIVALSLVAMASTIYTANVKAANQVKVEIRWWYNTCETLDDYDWGQKTASLQTIDLSTISNDLVCQLLASDSGSITISLTDLANSTIDTIDKENFKVAFWDAHYDGSLTARAAVAAVTFDNPQTFYPKWQYLVWNLSWAVALSWVIPAGKAVGQYVGQLNINVPNQQTQWS